MFRGDYMRADLHMHSTHSDGRKTTYELIDIAVKNGVDIIAITDHDTVQDVSKTMEYGKGQIPAPEKVDKIMTNFIR